DLRREYEEKRKAEADAQTKLRQDRELEKQQRQQMKKKAEEDKAKALAEASASVASPAPATPKRVPEKPTAKTPAAVKSSTTAPAAAAAATVKKSTAAPAAAPPATIKIEEMPSPPSPTPVSASSSRLVSQDALEWATKYRTLYARLMSEFAPQIQNDRDKRAYCSKHRGTLVRTFGQLKDSWVFVNRCIDTVSDILAESTRHGDAVHSWMLNLTAKAIVKQAEKEVSIAQHAAYPLATATVLLMQRFPQLVDLLLVRLVKKCPYVVPQYMAKRPGQSVEDYLRGIGYKMKSDDELESESIYNERMTGMLAL
ncbi:Nuclear pore complex nucleoporin component, partial [Coemansia sp. RSA 2320]